MMEKEPNESYSDPSINGTLADSESELSQDILKRHCFVLRVLDIEYVLFLLRRTFLCH